MVDGAALSGPEVPRALYRLAARGDKSQDAIRGFTASMRSRLEEIPEELIGALAKELEAWTDEVCAELLSELQPILEVYAGDLDLLIASMTKWAQLHVNDVESIKDCVLVKPPTGIVVKKLLSRRGGQKIVFLAEWAYAGRDVVLKKLVAPADEQGKILVREVQAHPLSISHPNIIETHPMQNADGDIFLVEEYLAEILGDDWRPRGVEEAACLLFEMASALSYLHVAVKRVHADVKPDNIGRRADAFVLLDFGMCRPLDELAEATATGSLRTRAPEVLEISTYALPDRVDVWALGAVLFNAFEGRFPLFNQGEVVPQVAETSARDALVKDLKYRAENEWETRLEMPNVPSPLQSLLRKALEKNPYERIDSATLRNESLTTLFVYLKQRAFESAMYSPTDELEQYEKWLLTIDGSLRLLPLSVKQKLKARLIALQRLPGLEDKQETLSRLLEKLQ